MYIISTVQIVIIEKKLVCIAQAIFFFHETTIFANSGWHITMQCIDLQTCFKQNILDRHHAWRSLDPTLDISSPFVKHFTSFFKKTQLFIKMHHFFCIGLSAWLSALLSALLSTWLSAQLASNSATRLSTQLSPQLSIQLSDASQSD